MGHGHVPHGLTQVGGQGVVVTQGEPGHQGPGPARPGFVTALRRPATGSPGASPGQGQVNINTADAGELERLPGIGPALAQRIVDYRREHGRFGAVEDLTDVPGIGPAKLRALKEVATV